MVAPALASPSRPAPAPPAGPSLTGRALVALGFLAGFYVIALGTVAALLAANVALYQGAGRASTQLVLVTVFVALAVVRGIFFLTRRPADLAGMEIDDHTQPELVGLVKSLAVQVGTEPPARILLVPEVNAAVTQSGGLLKLRHSQRTMIIGVPLIESLTVDQLRGVLAHELGHYAGGDTRLGALTYRAGASIYRTVEHLGEGSLLGRFFRAYGRRYLRLSLRVRRQQELSADAAAVWIAGRENHMSALRRVEGTSAAFNHLIRAYLFPLWKRGCDANAFEGYRALLADPTRQVELSEVEAEAHHEITDQYDSHPALAERLAYAQRLPEGPTASHDARPARELLRDVDGVERRVGALLTADITGGQMERFLEWDSAAADVYGSYLVDQGEHLLRAAATVAEEPECATLAAAIVLIEEGMGDKLAAALSGPVEGTPQEVANRYRMVLHDFLGSAIGAYLARERGHAWSVCWSGPLALVDGKGKPVDPWAMADSLLDDPASGGRLRRSLGGIKRLSAFRVEVASLGRDDQSRLPSVVHVVPDIGLERRHFDLVLTTAGIVLHPIAAGWAYAVRRLMASQGVGGAAAAATQHRLEALFSRPAEQVVGGAAGTVVVPLGDLRQVTKRRGTVVELVVAKEPRPWRVRCPSKPDRDLLLAALAKVRGGA